VQTTDSNVFVRDRSLKTPYTVEISACYRCLTPRRYRANEQCTLTLKKRRWRSENTKKTKHLRRDGLASQ